MKKLVLSIAAIAVFAFTSCSNDDDGQSCEELAVNIQSTGAAYSENASNENCVAYRSALQAYVDANCEDSATFEAMLENLSCN